MLLAEVATIFIQRRQTTTTRAGPTRRPAPVLLPVQAQTCRQNGRRAYATSATACARESVDTPRESTKPTSRSGARRRAATVRSQFPAGTRRRSLRWRRHRRAPGALSRGRAGGGFLAGLLRETKNLFPTGGPGRRAESD